MDNYSGMAWPEFFNCGTTTIASAGRLDKGTSSAARN